MKSFLRRRKQEIDTWDEESDETTEEKDQEEDSVEECCLWLCILGFLAVYPFIRSKWIHFKNLSTFEAATELATTTTATPTKAYIQPTPVLQLAELISNEELSCKDLFRLTCMPPMLATNVDYCGFNYLEKTEYLPKSQISECMRSEKALRFKRIFLSSIFMVIQNPKGGCDQTRPNHGFHFLRFDNSIPKFEALERMIRLIGNHWLHKHKIPVIISRYKWKFENSSDHNFFRNINKKCILISTFKF